MPDPVSTAVQPVDAVALEGSAAVVHDMSMIGMFLQADIVVKLVMLLLLYLSVRCWMIIYSKHTLFRDVRLLANRFEKDFWSSEALDKFYEKLKKKGTHPMSVVFSAAMEEWTRSKKNFSTASSEVKISIRERVLQVMLVARNREIESLENKLGFLATTGAAAPFIGLFGTVWGIMNSFNDIAKTQNTSLITVAPGIAEALFATALGLFAAIPAVIAYNRFSGEVVKFANRMEDFSTEFDTILSRQLEG